MLVTLRSPKVNQRLKLQQRQIAGFQWCHQLWIFLMSKSCGEQIMSEFSIVMTEESLKVVLSFPMKIFQSRLVILG